jgi:hypothetical protein
MTRSILGVCALAAVVVPFAVGCGASAKAAVTSAQDQRIVNLYEIDQIEKAFHKAAATHDVNLEMSLWAPGATFNVSGNTYTGTAQLRRFFAKQDIVFQPSNHWLADEPTYKIKISVYGNRATLYMECHFIDVKTRKVALLVGVDHNLQKIDGRWLIVDGAASATTLG